MNTDRETPQTNSTEAVCLTLEPETRWLLMRDLAARLERERDALRWTPLTERQPAEDDGNEYHDVEWSDGKEVWQNQFTNPNIGNRKATHWRSISLPNND